MNAHGLTDTVAGVVGPAAPCPSCSGHARLVNGICVSCLLQEGLRQTPAEPGESLDTLLARVDVRDTDWRVGDYDILEEIGRGGMGVIYKARQRGSRRIVALKRVLSYHTDSAETLVRFRREAEAAASLDHPNILPIYEVGEADGLPFFTMKFAPGGSLQTVKESLRDNPRYAVWLLARVARAVHHAHEHGILHRDLKPGNILLDGWREPMVSDFGLAKWLDATSDLTRTLTIFGTPGYIAPEQANGPAASLTPSADIYSLGAILFDLLTGRPPFLGEHALAVMRQAADRPAPKLRSLAPAADRDLETICAKCLERDAPVRYGSAADLAADLERWLAGRDIIARPIPPPVRLWRWSKRNPKLAATAAACLILAGAGFGQRKASSRLASIIREAELARQSVAVIPFEDLDAVSTRTTAAETTTMVFTAAAANTTGIHLRATPSLSEHFLIAFRGEDWKRAGTAAGARIMVSGNVRERAGKKRFTVRAVETATGSILRTWFRDDDSASESLRALVASVAALSRESDKHPDGEGVKSLAEGARQGKTHDSLARSYCERGTEFFGRYNLADVDRAIESFRRAVEIDPKYGEAFALLASATQARAQTSPAARELLEEAHRAILKAFELAPALPETHRAWGGILRRRGDLRGSIDPFITAYELDPSEWRTAALLGDAHEQLGRPDLAVAWFEKAQRLQARPLVADNIGNVWTSLGVFDKAEEAYRAATIFRPDLPVGALGLSRLAMVRGDFESAREHCAAARQRHPQNPEPLVMAALIEFYARNFARAEELYREAAAIDPAGGVNFAGSVRFLSALGFIKKNAGVLHEGNSLLDEASALDTTDCATIIDNPRRLYSRSATYAAAGDTARAANALDDAIVAGWIDHYALALDPRFDGMRESSSFQNTLHRLKDQVQAMRRSLPGRTLASNLH